MTGQKKFTAECGLMFSPTGCVREHTVEKINEIKYKRREKTETRKLFLKI